MQGDNFNWIKGIENDLKNSFNKRILWAVILVLSVVIIRYSDNISLLIGGIVSSDSLSIVSLILLLISFVGVLNSPEHPNYLAYYLYQIGSELSDFEIEENYLKRNKNFVKNSSKQLSSLIGVGGNNLRETYFTDDIISFLDELYDIILRLNYVYSSNEIDEQFMNERDFLSIKLINLANIIHKNHSNLTASHIEFAEEISNSLKDIPPKSLEVNKILLEFCKEKWNEQQYIVKITVLLTSIFFISYYIISQVEPDNALVISTMITVGFLTKIELFIKRERVK